MTTQFDVTTVWDKRDFVGEKLSLDELIAKINQLEDDIYVIEIWCGEDD